MDLKVAKNWCKMFSVDERVSRQRRTEVMAIEKIEIVSHQIQVNFIANKTLLVCDGYLCLNIGRKYENNYSRSFDNFGLIVQLDYNLCECEFEHQNSTIPTYLRRINIGSKSLKC